eukprot:TRINITY_DN9860_c0_g1_i21.p1 TRINITY_DN9860_c0_g1~~TRINITY_DN9860_c0_g1_i21.p1  ORF type:complete len:630 (+),score=144.61 TRINITY_DN9860_c0_g1_i21:99-1892(+)
MCIRDRYMGKLQLYDWLASCLEEYKKNKDPSSDFTGNVIRLCKKTSKETFDHIMYGVSKNLEQCVQQVFDYDTYSEQLKKQHQIKAFFFRMLEKILIASSGEAIKTKEKFEAELILLNENFQRALLAICLEAYDFISNPNIKSMDFQVLLYKCRIDAFEFWKILQHFMKVDVVMPSDLKSHMRELEHKTLSHLAWISGSVIHKLIKKLQHFASMHLYKDDITADDFAFRIKSLSLDKNYEAEDETDRTQNERLSYPYRVFFKKLVHWSALQIQIMGNELDYNDNLLEKVWFVFKYILRNETDLLINHHIDQIIVCCLFSVAKAAGIQKPFVKILETYERVCKPTRKEFDDFRYRVHVNNASRTSVDLIKYYNEFFVKRVHPLFTSYFGELQSTSGTHDNIMKEADQADSSSKAKIRLELLKTPAIIPLIDLQSPLKQNLVRPISKFLEEPPNHKNNEMTPFTKTLLAFDETLERQTNSTGPKMGNMFLEEELFHSASHHVIKKIISSSQSDNSGGFKGRHIDFVTEGTASEERTQSFATTSHDINSLMYSNANTSPWVTNNHNSRAISEPVGFFGRVLHMGGFDQAHSSMRQESYYF